MQAMTKSLSELFAILKTIEVDIKKEHSMLMVNKDYRFQEIRQEDKGSEWQEASEGRQVCCRPSQGA
jgi:hypothetical protein